MLPDKKNGIAPLAKFCVFMLISPILDIHKNACNFLNFFYQGYVKCHENIP